MEKAQPTMDYKPNANGVTCLPTFNLELSLFNLGISEIALIAVIALIFIGPKQLPEIARALGRALNELRRASEDLTSSITNPRNYSDPSHSAHTNHDVAHSTPEVTQTDSTLSASVEAPHTSDEHHDLSISSSSTLDLNDKAELVTAETSTEKKKNEGTPT